MFITIIDRKRDKVMIIIISIYDQPNVYSDDDRHLSAQSRFY